MKLALLRFTEGLWDYTGKVIAVLLLVAFVFLALGVLLLTLKWVTWTWTVFTL